MSLPPSSSLCNYSVWWRRYSRHHMLIQLTWTAESGLHHGFLLLSCCFPESAILFVFGLFLAYPLHTSQGRSVQFSSVRFTRRDSLPILNLLFAHLLTPAPTHPHAPPAASTSRAAFILGFFLAGVLSIPCCVYCFLDLTPCFSACCTNDLVVGTDVHAICCTAEHISLGWLCRKELWCVKFSL